MATATSTIGTALTTWDEFLRLPDPEDGSHYELHDGEVVLVAPAKPIHNYIQGVLETWLTKAARGCGRADKEFPYRPAANLQYWKADVAYLPNEHWANEHWAAQRGEDYPIYAPPLLIEVLSPSNRPSKIQRQRLAAFSAGTEEFWVVDPIQQTIEVSRPGSESRIYRLEDSVPVPLMPDAVFPVRVLFE